MNTLQPAVDGKKIPWIRALASLAVIAGLALAAPVLWLAVSGGVGLLALGLIGAAGFAVVQALPLMGQKLENGLLAARKAEARRNPIEQLQNEVVRRAERLRAFHKALVTVGGQIGSIEQMLVERRHKDPSHVLDRQERALQRLQQFQRANLMRLGQAQSALEEFRATVERKESEWRIALAIGEANDLMDPQATDNLMHELLADTALRSVQDRFNNVFAELDVQMSSMDGPTRTLLEDSSLDHMEELHLPQYTNTRSRS
jgi:hypothetical protein